MRGNLNVLEKIQKSTKLFRFQKKKATKIDEDGNECVAIISYKIKFIDSARFMATSLSNLVHNLTKGIYEIECKDCDCFLEYESVKGNLIKYKCLSWNKDYLNKIDEELKKRLNNKFRFSNNDISKFILLFRKGLYPWSIWMNRKSLMKDYCLKKKKKLGT